MNVRFVVVSSSLALALALAASGCSKKEPAPERTAAPSAPAAPAAPAEAPVAAGPNLGEAQKMFKTRCSVCHGMAGKGDGPGSAALNPKPRNYTDKVWQKSVTDEQIRNTILMGGAAVGKSPNMPASPDLQSKPQVLDGLVQVVRSFGK
ncbi:MAG TPA: c-type cytochrome [Polyangiaceae bacterium]